MTEVVKSKQEQVVERMIALRDQRAQLKAEFEAKDKVLRTQYENGEAWLLNEMQQAGATGLKFASGTVSQSVTMQASIGDWGAFTQFVLQSGEVDMLQKRISTTTLKEYLESHGDAVPPGVSVSNVRGITIRRATAN